MKTPHSQFFYIALSMMLCLIPTFVYAMSDYSLVRLDGELGIGLSSNGLVTGTTGAGSNPLFWNQAGMRLDSEPQPFVYGFGYAINETGLAIVDAGENGEGYFFWQNGKYTLIPLTIGVPARINNTGQVAAELPNGHVGRLSNGVLTDLGPLLGGRLNRVRAINSSGQIVGSAVTSSGVRHGVLWRDGAVIDLGTLPGDISSDAWDINDAGEVVGFSYSSSATRPFRWSNGVITEIAPPGTFDLATYSYPIENSRTTVQTGIPARPVGKGIFPRAINNVGQIVGIDTTSSVSQAFIWQNGVLTSLNPVLNGIVGTGCDATSINDAGQIVGRCQLAVYKLTPIAAGSNVSVSVVATPNPAVQGNSLTYNLNVTNAGSVTATDVNLTNALPSGVSFVSAATSQGTCSGTTVVTCALGSLAGRATASVQITVVPLIAGTLSNSVSVSSKETDTDTTNNTATTAVRVTAPVTTADLSVSLTGTPSSVRRYGNVTYSIRVTNGGSGSARSVTLRNILPSSMRFISATVSQGTCSGLTTVSCNLSDLATGATANLSIVAQARSRGTFTNSVTVSASTQDPTTSNNASSVTTRVN